MDKEVEKEVSKSESRREFLKRAGKFAVYTPPALALMSQSSHAFVGETNGQATIGDTIFKDLDTE